MNDTHENVLRYSKHCASPSWSHILGPRDLCRDVAVVKMGLNDLRLEAQEKAAEAEAKKLQANSVMAQYEAMMKVVGKSQAEASKAIREAKRAEADLDRAERLGAAEQEAQELRAEVEQRGIDMAYIAENFPWYTGIMEHQWEGILFGTVAKRWLLADEPGLGKTRQAIGWLDMVQAKKVIMIVPVEVCDQFAGETAELAPHREIVRLYGQNPKTRHKNLDYLLTLDEGTAILNYELFRRDKEALAKLMEWQADTLVVDEAHNMKSTKSANYKYIKTLAMVDNKCPKCQGRMRGLTERQGTRRVNIPCPACGWTKGDSLRRTFKEKLNEELASKSIKNVLLATGTPILNDPGELYPLLNIINPVLFPNQHKFNNTFTYVMPSIQRRVWLPNGAENLRKYIASSYLARKKEDAGIILPPQNVHTILVDLDKDEYPLQWRTVQQLTRAAQIILDNGQRMTVMDLIALTTRKRQANVWPGGITLKDTEGEVIFSVGDEVQESAKMDKLIEILIREHEAGRRQVVFSQFKTALAELEHRINKLGIRVTRLDGDTPVSQREEIRTNFYRAKGEDVKWDVLLANYKTGGVGLNLTSATVTHILDEEWNPGKRDQAYNRTNRMGQTEEMDVYRYIIPRTIDITMANLIHRKERMIDSFENMSRAEAMDLTEELKAAIKESM